MQNYNRPNITIIGHQTSSQAFATPHRFTLIALIVAISYLIMQHNSFTSVVVHLNLPGNDDLTRLLSVRDLLAGQAWFDTTQYNFVPPEGVSLHWSRYVDVGIVGLQWVLGLFLEAADAERWSVAIWPVFLFLLFGFISAGTMIRLYGFQAATFTLLLLITTGVLPLNYFAIGRIDHHNVQMVLMLVSAVLLTKEKQFILNSTLAGSFAALSLAVGLEGLLFFLVAGMFLLWHAILGTSGGRDQFFGFGLGIGVLTPLLYVGQISSAQWMQHHCDALSPPLLWSTSVAFLFSLIFYGIVPHLKTVPKRSLVALALLTASIFVLWPQLAACAEGPYGQLPDDLRRLALGKILEARPVTEVPVGIITHLLPTLACLFIAVYVLTIVNPLMYDRAALKGGWLFVSLLAVTTAGLMFQVRFAVLVFVVMPLVFGFTVSMLLKAPLASGGRIRIILLGFLLLTVLLNLPVAALTYKLTNFLDSTATVTQAVAKSKDNTIGTTKQRESLCRSSEVLIDLNKIPSGRVLSPINLGPAIALHTHHTALSAPYHRSVVAMENGFRVMGLPEEAFLDALQTVNADFLLICQGFNYGSNAITSDLAVGHTRDWAEPFPNVEGPLLLFRIRLD
jgi:hypothetical protein